MPDTPRSTTFQELGFFGPVKESQWNPFVHAVQNNIAHSRKEPGNLSFHLFQPEDGSLQPIWFERFTNKAAHNYHKEQSYFTDAIKVIQQSLAGEANAIELTEIEQLPPTASITVANPAQARHVIVLLEVKPGKRQLFIEAMVKAAPLIRRSAGNIDFNLYQYAADPQQFVLLEGWANAVSHEAQLKQPFIAALNHSMDSLLVKRSATARWLVKDISR